MDWTQTLTIILTIGASTAAVWYVVKEDIKRHDYQLSKMDERFDEKFSKMNEEFSKRDALWSDLLRQIYEIKLDQSRRS